MCRAKPTTLSDASRPSRHERSPPVSSLCVGLEAATTASLESAHRATCAATGEFVGFGAEGRRAEALRNPDVLFDALDELAGGCFLEVRGAVVIRYSGRCICGYYRGVLNGPAPL